MDPSLVVLLRSNGVPSTEQAAVIRVLLDAAERSQLEDLGVTTQGLPELLRSLRGTLSAIRSFPPELLGHIFLFCRNNSLETSGYSTTDSTQAPVILGHVCSQWRSISRSTPRLWDNVWLRKSAFNGTRSAFVQGILHRSRDVPLTVILEVHDESYGLDSPPSRCFDSVWDLHRRLKAITVDITSANPTSNMLPLEKLFHVLTSIDISISTRSNHDLDVAIILESFHSAPILRSVTIRSYYASAAILTAAFPWSQLTHLNLAIRVPANLVRDILMRCAALEEATLSALFEPDDISQPDICTLHHLHTLDISVDDGSGATVVLDALTLPRLESLSIDASDLARPVLPALHARSRFPLAHLTLEGVQLSPQELFSLFPYFSSLQTLSIYGSTCINRLFDVFAHPPTNTPQLPQLAMLALEITTELDGNIVATMVESLAPASDGARTNALFPALHELWLYPPEYALRFTEEVEERLYAARATGFLLPRNLGPPMFSEY
ncbi:hypothetical protein FB451DRAFT_1076957 [Mycena latifolia]|nr:hypothetical protein FB451DRAFT_1076957 [Mycena latifolia]